MRRAFTLLELVLVTAIIVILAGAMMLMFRVNKSLAYQAKTMMDLTAIRHAAVLLHQDTGQWPANSALPCRSDGTSLVDNLDADGQPIPGWKGPYLAAWKNDTWGHPYYVCEGEKDGLATQYATSFGLDDNPGGTGDNTDITLLITTDKSK